MVTGSPPSQAGRVREEIDDAGGLMSYRASLPDLVHLAYFVHRILAGTKPSDLSVELYPSYLISKIHAGLSNGYVS